jgi:hypothetical protein
MILRLSEGSAALQSEDDKPHTSGDDFRVAEDQAQPLKSRQGRS